MKKLFFILLSGIIIFTAGSSFSHDAEDIQEQPRLKYILISSKGLEHANAHLRESIRKLFPAAEETFLAHNSAQAKKYIEELGIKFTPFVIYNKSVALTDAFFHMVENRMVIKDKAYYVIPERQLKLGERMVLGRERRGGQLTLFSMSMCPHTKKAQAKLINFIRKNKPDVKLDIKYLVRMRNSEMFSLRGADELKEDKRQIIIQKYYPDKFFDYLLLVQDKDPDLALRELDIPLEDIDGRQDEALKILQAHLKEAEELRITRSPTVLWENVYLLPDLSALEYRPPFKGKGKAFARLEAPLLGPLPIDFFFSSTCSQCRESEELLLELRAKYKDKIAVNYHNISGSPEKLALRFEMEEEHGVLGTAIPEIFVLGRVLKKGEIKEYLPVIIEEALRKKGGPVDTTKKDALKKKAAGSLDENPILRRFSTFSPAVVVSLGLIDGVNPCAFATMIFFVSLLALNSYHRRQIACVGSAFIIGVFLAYLAIGLGIFTALQKLEIFHFFSRFIYYAIALLALGLGVYNLCDYISYKKTGEMKGCGLRIYERLRSLADKRRPFLLLIIATFVTGAIVALFEFPCTGQVYFPTIAFVMKVPRLRPQAFFYLVVYNLAFILPLIGVFILADRGITSERFARFSNRHTGAVRLTTALFFFALAVLLVVF
jgi:thiol-disulfide isomerase/thioredoxin